MIVLISPKALRSTLTSLFLATAAGAALTAPPPDGGLADLQASMQGLIIGIQPGTAVLPRPTLDTAEEVRCCKTRCRPMPLFALRCSTTRTFRLLWVLPGRPSAMPFAQTTLPN